MLLRTLALGGFLLAATAARADIQVYEVDAQISAEVVSVLHDALQKQCAGMAGRQCSARLLPSGQLLVEAPTETHGQIAAVLKAVSAHRAGPAPRVTLRYWVVVGTAGAAGDVGAKRAPPATLQPVLKQLESVYGDLQFNVAGTAAVTSDGSGGAPAVADGGPFEVSQSVRAVGDSLTASVNLSYKDANQELHVTVTIKRGEYLVLGEQSAAEGAGTTFYIVNWSE